MRGGCGGAHEVSCACMHVRVSDSCKPYAPYLNGRAYEGGPSWHEKLRDVKRVACFAEMEWR
jgi:hypothetical protein